MNIPKAGTSDGRTTRVAVLGVQAKQRDRIYAQVVQSSWYDTGSIKYAPCVSKKGKNSYAAPYGTTVTGFEKNVSDDTEGDGVLVRGGAACDG
ncbi:MAG: hypothetical protein IT161_00370 [Bryobacterales bacterium]|nr:hypothetical protein [Bryobacterales bacterium]